MPFEHCIKRYKLEPIIYDFFYAFINDKSLFIVFKLENFDTLQNDECCYNVNVIGGSLARFQTIPLPPNGGHIKGLACSGDRLG